MAFYVSIVDGSRFGLLVGPFNRLGDAARYVEPARRLAHQVNRTEATWAGFGTCHVKTSRARRGLLNDLLGVPAADLRGWTD